MTANSEAVEVQCTSCGALILVPGEQRTARCPFCDVPSVVSRPAERHRPQPVFALGFLIEQATAERAVKEWISRRKLAPFGLKNATAEHITGVYVPAYLYSATARSHYQASIAEHYSRMGIKRDSDGRTTLGNREETEYRDLTGRHVAYVADLLVTASHRITNAELEAIEPFDLGKLRHFSPALISGWMAEEPSLFAEECLRRGRVEAEASVARVLRAFMPGDGVRSLQHTVDFQEESLDPLLVPVWVCAIRDHPQKPPLRVLVNGQTGKASGVIPFSWAKLGILLALGLGLLALLPAVVDILARIFR